MMDIWLSLVLHINYTQCQAAVQYYNQDYVLTTHEYLEGKCSITGYHRKYVRST